jgi:Asp/Glu/hydantoin racemase
LSDLKEKGYPFYGYSIGILVMDTAFGRIPGDIGNALTWDFPVYYKVVKGATFEKVVLQGDPQLVDPFARAARELEAMGVRAITTSCGFLALFQQQLAEAVNIPVFTSSLLQIPLASRMLGRGKKVGILTAHSQSLTERHLVAVGAEAVPHVIIGLEGGKEFPRFLSDISYNPLEIEKETVGVAKELLKQHPEVGAIVLECANLPPYGRAIQEATGLPVFDIVTLTEMVHSAVVKKEFITRR